MSIYRDKDTGRWCFEFSRRIDGGRFRKRRLLPAGWTRTQADAYDRKESAALYAVATGIAKPRHTVDEAVACYLKERIPMLKAGENTAREIEWMRDWFAGRALEDLPEVCAEYAEDQEGALAPATIKNRIAYLRAACRFAWKKRKLCEHDPGARVVAPSVSNEKTVFLSRKQMLQLARACGSWEVRAMMRISFYSGMRLDEIRRARVEDGCWVLDDTKNGEARIVPMHERCRAYSDYLWPSKGMVAYWTRKAVKAANSPEGVTFHTLRHSCATALLKEGVAQPLVGHILGHKSAASMKRYGHYSADSIKDAVSKIGRRSGKNRPDLPTDSPTAKAA